MIHTAFLRLKSLGILVLTALAVSLMIISCSNGNSNTNGNIDVNDALSIQQDLPPIQDLTIAPTKLSDGSGNWMVKFTWTAVEGADSYSLVTSLSPDMKNPTTYAVHESPYTINNVSLTEGATLYCTISILATINGVQKTFTSKVFSKTLPSVSGNVPGAFTLSGKGGDKKVSLSWTDSKDAAYYVVYKGTQAGGPYTSVTGLLTVTNYTDSKNIVNGTQLYYSVSAVNAKGSTKSTVANSTTGDIALLPNPFPTAFNVSASPSADKITLTWPQSLYAVSYTIQRGTSSGQYDDASFTVKQPDDSTAQVTYVDMNLPSGTSYYYLVTAVNDTGTKSASEISATTSGSSSNLGLPGDFTVTSTANDNTVSLNWTQSARATTYSIYRGTVTNTYNSIPIASGLTTLTYSDTGLTSGTEYFYLVKAINDDGNTPAEEVSSTPYHAPLAFTASILQTGPDEMTISWEASVGATSYSIKRREEGSSYPGSYIATNITNPLSYVEPLDITKTYYYKIYAINTNGSTTVEVITPIVISSIGGNGKVKLTWTLPQSNIATFSIIRGTSSGNENSTPIASGLTSNSYIDSTATNNQIYFYKLVANYPGDVNVNSNEVSATPTPTSSLWQGSQVGTIASYESHGIGIGQDAVGNIYATGYTNGELDGQSNPSHMNKPFIVKYDTDGTKLWTKLLYPSRTDGYPDNICVTASGDIYIVGDLQDNGDWRDGSYFVAKLTTNGDVAWTYEYLNNDGVSYPHFSGAANCALNSDASKIYVTGFVWDYGFPDAASPADQSGFVMQFDTSTGVKDFTQIFATTNTTAFTSSSEGFGLIVDGSDLYVAARSAGIFPDSGITYSQGFGTLLIKFDLSSISLPSTLMTPQWYKQMGTESGGYSGFSRVYTGRPQGDPTKYAYGVGFGDNAFGGAQMNGANDLFILKYKDDGTFMNSAFTGAANVHLSPGSRATSTFDSTTNSIIVTGSADGFFASSSTGYTDMFITKYSLDNDTYVWKRQFGASSANTNGAGVSSDASGNIYVIGTTNGNFDGIDTGGMNSYFISKYDSNGTKK